MPRGGRSRASRPAAPAPAPVRRPPAPAPVPAPAPPAAAAPVGAQQRQPGLFAQMATTAAGVAVGSAVGHTISGAILGGGGGQSQEAAPVAEAAPAQAAPAQAAPAPIYQQHNYDPNASPCAFQLKQFLECTQTQHDISLCSAFNEALKECKVRYGLQ